MSTNIQKGIHSFFIQQARKDQNPSRDENTVESQQVDAEDVELNHVRRKRQRTASPVTESRHDSQALSPNLAPMFIPNVFNEVVPVVNPSLRRGRPRKATQSKADTKDAVNNHTSHASVVDVTDSEQVVQVAQPLSDNIAPFPDDIERAESIQGNSSVIRTNIPSLTSEKGLLQVDITTGTLGSSLTSSVSVPLPKPAVKKKRTRKVAVKNTAAQHVQDSVAEPTPKTQIGIDSDMNKETDTRSSNVLFLDSTETRDLGPSKCTVSSMKRQTPPPQQLAKKVLHFNIASGTIGSPPKRKEVVGSNDPPRSRRGRRPKALLVKIKYANDKDSIVRIGQKIDIIMRSPGMTVSTTSELNSKIIPVPPKSTEPAKRPHPFFLGKTKPKLETQEEIEKKPEPAKSFFTSRTRPPGHIHTTTLCKQNNDRLTSTTTTFSATKRAKIFPDSIEPLWPPRFMMHVRGLEFDSSPIADIDIFSNRKERKSKYAAPEETLGQDLLDTFTSKLKISSTVNEIKTTNIDDFEVPDKGVRLPEKHFWNGLQLQGRVRKQLHPNSIPQHILDGQPSSDQPNPPFPHPAVLNLYNTLATSLSSFDKHEASNRSWAQKYAPTTASAVLSLEHKNKDAYLLRKWLKDLTVIAVESGTMINSQNQIARKKRKRKKRKLNDIDSFIVHSDESDGSLESVSDVEEAVHMGSQDSTRSTVRHTSDPAKTKGANTVVITGPTGCGKTAMVYAVAKELGFEVFEINPGSRRSGKDILDRVGDMTKNHLVQNASSNTSAGSEDEDSMRHTKALAADLASGRQNTMSSFFKPEPKLKSTNKSPSQAKQKVANMTKQETAISKVPSKEQKQSLILLEEADVLFRDDKDFWATVLSLIAQSKRPVIITCNDESAVPIASLTLGAILRPRSPPLSLAVDYVLLIAAHEGHALRREFVESLYKVRNNDLRGLLIDLEFWCQMAVGDRKSGVDWFVDRFPRGRDLDAGGHVIRTISSETYRSGMGWLNSHQFTKQSAGYLVGHALQTREIWENFQLHPRNIYCEMEGDSRGKVSTVNESVSVAESISVSDNLPALKDYEEVAETMSMADYCFGGQLATQNSVLMDTTLPKMPEKVKNDYVLGSPGTVLLQADIQQELNPVSLDIAFYIMNEGRLNTPRTQSILSTTDDIILKVVENRANQPPCLSRRDLSKAFDSITTTSHATTTSAPVNFPHSPSVFDRSISAITLDVAPYVRSIVAYDMRLAQERTRLHSLMSQSGVGATKMRKTRSAYSALEGGKRSSTRKEAYFEEWELDVEAVARTGFQTLRNEQLSTSEPDDAEVASGEVGIDELAC